MMEEKKEEKNRLAGDLPKKRAKKIAKKRAPRKKAVKVEKPEAAKVEKREEATVAAVPEVVKPIKTTLDKLSGEELLTLKKRRFIQSIGRRKRATAVVKLQSGTGKTTINNKELNKYFLRPELQQKVVAPLILVGQRDKCDVIAKVIGGGANGQAEAIRMALARNLKLRNIMFRAPLKKAGFLTRDEREKERKKYGLKRARRGPQWSKR